MLDINYIHIHTYGVNPLRKVDLWAKEEGQIAVPQSTIVKLYNKGWVVSISVTEVFSDLRPTIGNKKWHWHLLLNAFGISLIIHYSVVLKQKITSNEFRRNIAKKSSRIHLQDRASCNLDILALSRFVNQYIRKNGVNHIPGLSPVWKCIVCEKMQVKIRKLYKSSRS